MTSPLSVLIVEDSAEDAILVMGALERGGYNPVFERVETETAMSEALNNKKWDLIIADYRMPTFSGIAALRLMRSYNLDLPFIVVSGAIGEDLAVEAMKAGAHDYLLKGNLARLPAAVERELREVNTRRARIVAESSLRAAEKRYRQLVELSPDGIIIFCDNKVVYCNTAALRIYGASSSEEFIGRHLHDIVHPDCQATVEERIIDALTFGRKAPLMEELHKRLDGSPVHVEAAAIRFDYLGKPAIQSVVRDIDERHHAAEALRNANQRLQGLSIRVLQVQEAERRHLARELHDEIGQSLTAIKILQQSAKRGAEEKTASLLAESVEITDLVLEQVRTLSLDLHPPQLDDLGLLAALRWHLDRQTSRAGISLKFKASPFSMRLAPDIEIACFRVAQEAVTNIIRHANASNIWCDLSILDQELRLMISDDGCGFDVDRKLERANTGDSMGLSNMHERVSLVGGRMQIRPVATQGTEIFAAFPLRYAAPQKNNALPEG